MLKIYSLLLIACVSFAPFAHAQEDADAVLKEMAAEQGEATQIQAEGDIAALPDVDANYEERLELSRKMHEIWPIRPKIENALEVVSQQVELTRRLEFKSGMRKAIQYDALEEASIDAMADIFTADELKAMINFYGSKEGRSVSFKTADYEKALIPLMTQMVDKALLDLKLGTE